jgi:hypothetical protein
VVITDRCVSIFGDDLDGARQRGWARLRGCGVALIAITACGCARKTRCVTERLLDVLPGLRTRPSGPPKNSYSDRRQRTPSSASDSKLPTGASSRCESSPGGLALVAPDGAGEGVGHLPVQVGAIRGTLDRPSAHRRKDMTARGYRLTVMSAAAATARAMSAA